MKTEELLEGLKRIAKSKEDPEVKFYAEKAVEHIEKESK